MHSPSTSASEQPRDDIASAIDDIRTRWRRQHLSRAAEAHRVAAEGRGGDTDIAHVTPGEMVLHPSQLSPNTLAMIVKDLARGGIGVGEVSVGSADARVNPRTGVAEYRVDDGIKRWKPDPPPPGIPNHVFTYTREGQYRPNFNQPPNFPGSGPDRGGMGAFESQSVPRIPVGFTKPGKTESEPGIERDTNRGDEQLALNWAEQKFLVTPEGKADAKNLLKGILGESWTEDELDDVVNQVINNIGLIEGMQFVTTSLPNLTSKQLKIVRGQIGKLSNPYSARASDALDAAIANGSIKCNDCAP
ncbi:MAG: hypothetical protein ACKVQK_30420 [Burkholderiales bacterium]